MINMSETKITAYKTYSKYYLHEGIDAFDDAVYELNMEAQNKLGHRDYSLEDIEYDIVLECTATLINHAVSEESED